MQASHLQLVLGSGKAGHDADDEVLCADGVFLVLLELRPGRPVQSDVAAVVHVALGADVVQASGIVRDDGGDRVGHGGHSGKPLGLNGERTER